MRRTLLRGSALLLGGILLGMLLLAAAYALPVEPIRKHLEESLVCFDGSDDIKTPHIALALQLRSLDRKYFT